MVKRISKFLSVMLVICMVISMIPAVVFAASLSTLPSTLYLKPNSNWLEADARFAAYYYGTNSSGVWESMSDPDGDGVYEAPVPTNFEYVIFCRMDPSTTTNSWDYKWNQTSDLTIPGDGTDCYTIEDGTWDNGNGTWSTFGTDDEPTTPDPVIQEYYLVGYINGANYGCEEDYTNLGTYKFISGALTATFTSDSYVFLKTGDNANWYLAESYCTDTTCNFVTSGTEKMYVPGNVQLNFTLVVNDDGSLTLSYEQVASECTHSYTSEVTKEPTCLATGTTTYTCSLCGNVYTEEIAATGHDYEITVVAPTCENNGYTIHACKNCTYSYNDTAVNPIGHNYSSVVTAPTCTAQGYTTYTCANCGNVYTWNTTAALGHSYVSGVCTTCGEADPDYTPEELDYYLFGYINGADYGINDDIDNLGEYKFVDGQLTVKFSEESYVAVKTSDNASFYMTNGYVGSATSATLYLFTDPNSTSANKLQVPGGQTVTFTLTENWDGNLIISYTVDTSDCVHVSHNTDGVCTTCGATVEHTYSAGVCTVCSAADPDYVPYDYYLFGYINGANYGCEEDSSNLGDYLFVDGQLTVTFTADSYIGVKEVNPNAKYGAEVVAWYMTDGWQGEVTSVTLYNSSSLSSADKLYVPGGVELTITITKSGDTVLLSYAATGCTHSYSESVVDATCTTDGSKTYTCTSCGYSYSETIAATGHNYVDGACSNCGAADPNADGVYYSLVGYINGANYGCEEDYENAGDYKFVNGTLKVTFTADSYVFVKTSDNANWYLASAYCTDTTCTFVIGGTEKMYVPGGVELTFTLVENADGSVTLSYITAGTTVTVPTITLSYPTLAFEDEILYNAYFTVDDASSIVEMGMITFSSKLTDGTISDAVDVISGYTTSSSNYIVHSNGIPAKNLGDALYFKVYAKLSDGTYAYSDVAGYNAVAYAKTILNSSSSSDAAKALVVAMLNYGAAAQTYFGYNTSSLMNASLTAAQLALVGDYSESMVASVVTCTKSGSFVNNGGYSTIYPTVSFESAFAINYYFATNYTPDSAPTFYYWDAATYNSVSTLTAANATGTITMTLDGDQWYGTVSGIAAKEIDQTYYTAGIYTSGGTTYTSPVISYSLGKYCQTVAANGEAFGAATAVYGYYAKAYFA